MSCAVAMGAAGCAGVASSGEYSKTIGSSLGQVTGAVIGHQYGQAGIGSGVGSDLGGLTGSAVGSMQRSGASPTQKSKAREAQTKFCPTGGERYPDSFKYCPIHGDALRPLAE